MSSSSASPAVGNSASSSNGSLKDSGNYEAMWDLAGDALDQWVRSVPAMQPKLLVRSKQKPTKEAVAAAGHANQCWANLHAALQALQAKTISSADNVQPDEQQSDSVPPTKRIKLENGTGVRVSSSKLKAAKKERYEIIDPFDIYVHAIRKQNDANDDEDDPLDDPVQEAAKTILGKTGAKLTQLTISGILNGMAGAQGGVVSSKQLELTPGFDKQKIPISTQANASIDQLTLLATALHAAIQTRIETDVLTTTPLRIQEMLAPDLLDSEFKAIRRRVYDTVILGKGLAQPDILDDIPTAPSSGVHDIEKFKKCKSCGNNDQSSFVLDRKNGDVICEKCGTVVSESLMHEGSQYRKFEGEIDRNHHGDMANPLYSNAHNMSTTLGGLQATTGAGLGGFGSQKKGIEVVLRNTHAYTELNISQFGRGDRRTRIGYKDKQKKDAFVQMAHCGDALNLHEAVVQRAKELFAGFRDDRELVQQFKGVIASCLCEAFDQLSNDGKLLLKQKQDNNVPQETFNHSRATRRNELHHANLAGKGGLLLDFSAVKQESEETTSSVSQKTASTWDLDDCRSWLLEISMSIAQTWIDGRKKGEKGIPEGPLDELQGKLVEHSIALCDKLEEELKRAEGKAKTSGRGRVTTPRVHDMAKLGIKWQHSHERGSGGKGGVGGSGTNAPNKSGRTAGQILILKTAKKLGEYLNDPFAGNSIHKELRSLVGKQAALKRKKQLEEATRQRFAQMQRKPWLQARAQED